MTTAVTDPRLILTCGLPGAGKTALATRLASERRAVRLTKDEWLWALGSTPWDRHTGEKVERELWRCIEIRNSEPPWNNEPIARADLNEWLEFFEAPDASELALFDPPPDSTA